jgi:hypothetical protein
MLRTKGYQIALDSGYQSSILAKFVHDFRGRTPANSLNQLIEDVPLSAYVAVYSKHSLPRKMQKDRLLREFEQYCRRGELGSQLIEYSQELRNASDEISFIRELHAILDALFLVKDVQKFKF